MARRHVESVRVPRPLGPYSAAVWAGDLLYVSGQTPIEPKSGALIEGSVEEQTHRCFDNLEGVLLDAGLSMDDVIKCNVYLADMADFQDMNAAYEKRFTRPFPARTTVAVRSLPRDALVEIELVAKRP